MILNSYYRIVILAFIHTGVKNNYNISKIICSVIFKVKLFRVFTVLGESA